MCPSIWHFDVTASLNGLKRQVHVHGMRSDWRRQLSRFDAAGCRIDVEAASCRFMPG